MAALLSFRELALRLSRTQLGVTEHPPGSNRGAEVEKYQSYTDAGVIGFPWCAAFVSRNLALAGYNVKRIKNRASVGFFLQWAQNMDYVVTRPFRGDLVTYLFDTADVWPDHMGHVERVLSFKPFGYYLLQTIEGNTSSGSSGSQSNGGMVARRRRLVRRSRVSFIRIPGMSNVKG